MISYNSIIDGIQASSMMFYIVNILKGINNLDYCVVYKYWINRNYYYYFLVDKNKNPVIYSDFVDWN